MAAVLAPADAVWAAELIAEQAHVLQAEGDWMRAGEAHRLAARLLRLAGNEAGAVECDQVADTIESGGF